MHCYGQSCYKYRIRIGARVLICRDLGDRVVDGGSWSDSHTEWIKVHLSMTYQHTKPKIWLEPYLLYI